MEKMKLHLMRQKEGSLALMQVLCDTYPNLVLDYTTMLKMVVECSGRLTEKGASSLVLVRAIRTLIVLKPELKDFTVLILHKSLFNHYAIVQSHRMLLQFQHSIIQHSCIIEKNYFLAVQT